MEPTVALAIIAFLFGYLFVNTKTQEQKDENRFILAFRISFLILTFLTVLILLWTAGTYSYTISIDYFDEASNFIGSETQTTTPTSGFTGVMFTFLWGVAVIMFIMIILLAIAIFEWSAKKVLDKDGNEDEFKF